MKKFLVSLLLMVFIIPVTLQAQEAGSTQSKFFYDFNDKSLDGWMTIDRDNDERNWLISDDGYIYSESAETIKPNNIIATTEKYAIFATSKISFDVRPETDKNVEKYGIGVVYSLDGESFMTLQDETELASTTEWNKVEISLEYIANKEVYIGILHNTYSDQGNILVDNVKLTDGKLPTAEEVTATENGDNVDITWNAPTEEFANYNLSGYRLFRTRGDETPDVIANETAETSYQDTEWKDAEWGIYKYGVAALYQPQTRGDVETLLEEGFETTQTGIIPEGWTKLSDPSTTTSVSGPWTVAVAIANLANPNSGEQFAFSYGGYDLADFYLITPAIDLTKALNPTLEFSFIGPIGIGQETGNPIYVKYSESATGPWTTLYENTTDRLWQDATINLSTCSGKTIYLAFVHEDTKTFNFGVGIDDIKVTAQIAETNVAISSDIVWSNKIEKDMETTAFVNVTASDNGSVSGATVTLTNVNEADYKYEATLDETGKAQFEVRRGSYKYNVSLEGYYDLEGTAAIYDETTIDCTIELKPTLVEGLYVSPTAWAMWEYDEENITYDVRLNDQLVAENITDKYFQFDETTLVEGQEYTTTVFPKSLTDNVMMEYTWEYTSCKDFANIVNFKVNKEDNKAVLSWTMPIEEEQVAPVYEFSSNFDNGTLEGWTTIDADGDKRNWQNTSEFATQGFGVNNTYCAASISYDSENDVAISPDNFLVTMDRCSITETSKLTFSVAAQSKNDPAEHYGVAISTKSNTKAEDFKVIFDETLTTGNVDSTSIQGQWFERTVDLSQYAGQNIYIAFRHYNSANNFWINLDNVSLTSNSTRSITSNGGEWLYYDNGVCESASGNFDASTNTPTQIFWAIMFPADIISDYANRNISKVAVFDYSAHKGAFSIHKGGDDAPGEMIHFQSYETSGKKSYVEIELDKPVKISGKDNIWIQFSNEYGSGTYQAAYSKDMGDPNSRWRSDNGSLWYDSNWFGEGWYGTWMIRAFVDEKDESIIDEPEFTTVETLGAFIYRNGKLITPEPIRESTYTDAIAENEESVEYSIRVVYGGEKDYTYYAMSCPTIKTLEEVVEPIACERPKGLYGETTLNNDGSFGATLVWPYLQKWFYYDDGNILESGIGTNGNGTINWGIMIPAKDLKEYNGAYVTKVSLYDIEACNATLNIAYGGDFAPAMTVHSQNFKFEGTIDYKDIYLNAPIPVTGEENIWITINCDGKYPAAITKKTADPNGRWCSLDGNTWGDISAMGQDLDYSWYLRAYIANEPNTRGNDATLDHYNVYRSTTNSNYELIAETSSNRYFDEIEKGTYYYQVKAVYTRDEETCESEAATTHEDPNKDYIVIEVTTINENGVNGMMVYPNPTKGDLNITAENMNRITISNVLGQVIYDKNVNSDNEIINMSNYETGIYMVRIATESGVAVKRISVTK